MKWEELLSPKARGGQAFELALAIAQAYGYILEKATAVINRESELPLPRDAIKLSLLLLHSIEKDVQRKSLLRANYGFLSHFQPLTDEEMHVLGVTNAPINMPQHVEEQKALVASRQAAWALAAHLTERAMKESAELEVEFDQITGVGCNP